MRFVFFFQTRTPERVFRFIVKVHLTTRADEVRARARVRIFASHALIPSSSQNGPAMKFVHGKKTWSCDTRLSIS